MNIKRYIPNFKIQYFPVLQKQQLKVSRNAVGKGLKNLTTWAVLIEANLQLQY